MRFLLPTYICRFLPQKYSPNAPIFGLLRTSLTSQPSHSYLLSHIIFFGNKRFNEISKAVKGVTDKMLSKELKSLEMNHLIKRMVYDTFPPTVEYSITEYGKSLEKVLTELGN